MMWYNNLSCHLMWQDVISEELWVLKLMKGAYRQEGKTTNEAVPVRATADIEHVTCWKISLHIRDRHLWSLTAVARQQPSRFYSHFFIFLNWHPPPPRCYIWRNWTLACVHFNTLTVTGTTLCININTNQFEMFLICLRGFDKSSHM